ncbi:MAG: recombinase family protein [Saccharofermentanales bacterium]
MGRIIQKVAPVLTKLPAKKRVAAYARVSNKKDAMLCSLSAQVSYFSAYIQRNKDWQYVGAYVDEALTGTKDSRTEFQRLLSDCRAGRIDLVITKSISRFARNTVTMLEVVRELKALGVDVYFEKENIHSISGDGELMLTILSSYAQEESRSVSENCKWRIRKKFSEGIPNTFKIYGYDMIKNKLYINQKEAAVIKMIFDDYLSGLGRLFISNKLNSLGIKTKKGRGWDSTKIRDILKNEKYTGDLLLQKTFKSDHLGKKNRKNDGILPQVLVSRNHQAIIDRETFDRAQSESKNRKERFKAGTATTQQYAFTGLITCGICGKHFQRKLNNAGTKYAKAVWICSKYNRLGKASCESKQIPESVLIGVDNEPKNQISNITAFPDNRLVVTHLDHTTEEVSWKY